MSDFTAAGIRYQLIASRKWQWMEEYVLASAKYVLLCPPSRTCEYGSGLFSGGNPLGAKRKFSGSLISVYGAGSIHVRLADGGGSCLVGIAQLDRTLISLNTAAKAVTPGFWAGIYEDFEKWWREHHHNQMPPLDRL